MNSCWVAIISVFNKFLILSIWIFFTIYRAAFEGYLRSHYTTLTTGEILTIKQANSSYQFVVDSLKPANAVQVVDTDLEVEILPLSGEEASINIDKDIHVGQTIEGIVQKDDYDYCNLTDIDKSHGLNIVLNIIEGDAGKHD